MSINPMSLNPIAVHASPAIGRSAPGAAPRARSVTADGCGLGRAWRMPAAARLEGRALRIGHPCRIPRAAGEATPEARAAGRWIAMAARPTASPAVVLADAAALPDRVLIAASARLPAVGARRAGSPLPRGPRRRFARPLLALASTMVAAVLAACTSIGARPTPQDTTAKPGEATGMTVAIARPEAKRTVTFEAVAPESPVPTFESRPVVPGSLAEAELARTLPVTRPAASTPLPAASSNAMVSIPATLAGADARFALPAVTPLNRHFRLEVINGVGVEGGARSVGRHLHALGGPVAMLRNARPFIRAETIVFYSAPHAAQARRIATELGAKLAPAGVAMKPGADVRVLLGHDMRDALVARATPRVGGIQVAMAR